MCCWFLIYFSSFSLGLCSDPFVFQVKNANLTIQLLKQVYLGQANIQAKLWSWEQELESNPSLLEKPAPNFHLLKMLMVDLEESMIPTFLRDMFSKTENVLRSEDLKTASLRNDMMNLYDMQIRKELFIIGFLTRSISKIQLLLYLTNS